MMNNNNDNYYDEAQHDENNDMNNNDSSFHTQNQHLLSELNDQWNKIEMNLKAKNQKKTVLFHQESTYSEQIESRTFVPSTLMHPYDNSFDQFARKKMNELEAMKIAISNQRNQLKHINEPLGINDISMKNQQNYTGDPTVIINDNSRLEKQLKNVMAMIIPPNEDNNQIDIPSSFSGQLFSNTFSSMTPNSNKPKKSFLKNDTEETKDKKNKGKYGKTPIVIYEEKTKKTTLPEENETKIKNKIQQNTMLIKQLYSQTKIK